MAIMCPTRYRFQDGSVGVNIIDLDALMVCALYMRSCHRPCSLAGWDLIGTVLTDRTRLDEGHARYK